MTGIEDKIVAITGASGGIGEATALMLAERGAKVVLGARGKIVWNRWRPASWRRVVKSPMPRRT